jgi:hypothetical protein
MSEEQLSALLAKLKEEAGLQEKLKGAADLDPALAIGPFVTTLNDIIGLFIYFSIGMLLFNL